MHLEELSNAFGVSSIENEVRDIILSHAQPYADAWQVDTMGNLLITRNHRKKPSGPLQRVMIAAHMDEVGFMVTQVSSDGLLKFQTVGGFDKRVLLGKRLVIGKKRIPGVIGTKPVHLLPSADWHKVGSIDSLRIDIGARDKTNANVNIGDFATFATKFGHMGSKTETSLKHGRVKGKAFDDRVGCAILLELLKGDYPFDLIAAFTVQEEVGARGANVAAYTTNPNLAFILECTAADDIPSDDEDQMLGFPCLGDGPAITVMDASMIANRPLVDLLVETAKAETIPYQFKRPGIGGTDGGAIHLARAGIPSAVVSVPGRYIHSPTTIIDLADFWNTVKLMQATLQQLPII